MEELTCEGPQRSQKFSCGGWLQVVKKGCGHNWLDFPYYTNINRFFIKLWEILQCSRTLCETVTEGWHNLLCQNEYKRKLCND